VALPIPARSPAAAARRHCKTPREIKLRVATWRAVSFFSKNIFKKKKSVLCTFNTRSAAAVLAFFFIFLCCSM
jgi:hypothetical protein